MMSVIAAVFGLAIGSFLNVCIDRLPAGQSILRPRSHCPVCKTPLVAPDLMPVLSYLLLRGRCRYCSAPIPKRLLLVEAGTGLLFLLLWSLYGPSLHFLLAAIVASVMVAVLVMGFEHRSGLKRGPGSPQSGRTEVRDSVRR